MADHRVVLDVDTGIDDALMIMHLAASPEAEIVAAGSVHGNVDAPRAALNTLRVLEICGLTDVPVAEGAREPLVQPLRTAWMVHGSDGLGNTDMPPPQGAPVGESAADQLVRLSREQPGELHLLAVGPLTNLALALRQDPAVLSRFRSVTIMGGSGVEALEVRALALDANIDHDPEAADLVFAADAHITLAGTNLEPYLAFSEANLERLAAATEPHAVFANRIVQFYADFQMQLGGRRVIKLWDPLAAAMLLDPPLITSSTAGPVDIVKSERGFRALHLKDRREQGRFSSRPDACVVTSVDADRFVADVLAKLTSPMPVR